MSITEKANQQSLEFFANWAKTLLQDFNEIDRYLLEPNLVLSYLKGIEDIKNWKKTKGIIRRDSKDYEENNLGKNTKGTWQKAHRNIAFLGDNPDAILASLPAFLSREIIFQNKNGIHYFYLTWQLGKISRVGSRINTVLYMIGIKRIRIKDSNVNYSKLKYLRGIEI